ncbi:MAG: rhamnan synthesis F family protein, partial [Bacillota bacterium]
MQEVKNRFCIYFLYDKDGIADRYILHMLSSLCPYCTEIAVVSNGKLQEDSKSNLEAIVDQIIERENVGFDVWAYKTTLELYGWNYLNNFDEIILMNHTIMGPVYSFDVMFSTMSAKTLDFWGITTFHKIDHDPFGKSKYGNIPLHLQSHFIAVRKSLFSSKDFHRYWEDMPMICSYEESVCYHEAIFTKTFESLGYQWKSYVDTSDLFAHNNCPIIHTPTQIIEQKGCPIFKRRSFFHNYDGLLGSSLGKQGSDLMTFLKEKTDYNVDFVWENILRLENMSDIQKCLNLNYIVPKAFTLGTPKKSEKIALIFHLYYEDLFEQCYQYALSFPCHADVYLTTPFPENVRRLEELFGKGPWNKVEVLLIKNQGRDVSALLVGGSNIVPQYEYICFAHDKKSATLSEQIIGESFSYHCFENVLGSSDYVCNILDLFEANPRLGLLSPPPPYHASYYSTVGNEWGTNYLQTKKLAQRLHLHVNISEDKEPVAPLGTIFWFRTAALKSLFSQKFEYNDFPLEPNGT